MPESTNQAALQAAWGKVNLYCDRIFDALQELEEVGGLSAVAEAGGWSPKAKKKALATLQTSRDAIAQALEPERARRPIRGPINGPGPLARRKATAEPGPR